MGKRRTASANDNPERVQLGPFWLWYRADRDDWSICWYANEAGRGRRTSRKSASVAGRPTADGPPQEAIDALAKHYADWRKPVAAPLHEALVEELLASWLAHVAKVDEDPRRAQDAAKHWLLFFEHERAAGRIIGGPYVSDIKSAMVQRYIDWRKAQPGKRRGSAISGATISRELAALRASLRHAWANELIPSAPFIPDVSEKDKARPKELVYSPEQIARLLEAAIRIPERWHVHLFAMIMLSTHGRGEAILELDADSQIRDGLIHFLAPGESQTKKRRSIVPIAPTLAPWLAGIEGKVIVYRTAKKSGELVERPTASIKTAFAACLIEAGICEPGPDGPIPIGSPNTLRHTIATELHRRGVPDAQIDAAAGHAGTGTNKKNYRHLRPDYLNDLVAAVEDFWAEVGKHTTAHLRYQRDTNIIDLAAKRAGRKS